MSLVHRQRLRRQIFVLQMILRTEDFPQDQMDEIASDLEVMQNELRAMVATAAEREEAAKFKSCVNELPELARVFSIYWVLFGTLAMNGSLPEDSYITIHRLLQIGTKGKRFEEEYYLQNAREDWRYDSYLYGNIDQFNFNAFLFDFLVTWSDVVYDDAFYYAAFAWALLDGIADLNQQPPRIRPKREIQCPNLTKSETEILADFAQGKVFMERLLDEVRWMAPKHQTVKRRLQTRRGAVQLDKETLDMIYIYCSMNGIRIHQDAEAEAEELRRGRDKIESELSRSTSETAFSANCTPAISRMNSIAAALGIGESNKNDILLSSSSSTAVKLQLSIGVSGEKDSANKIRRFMSGDGEGPEILMTPKSSFYRAGRYHGGDHDFNFNSYQQQQYAELMEQLDRGPGRHLPKIKSWTPDIELEKHVLDRQGRPVLLLNTSLSLGRIPYGGHLHGHVLEPVSETNTAFSDINTNAGAGELVPQDRPGSRPPSRFHEKHAARWMSVYAEAFKLRAQLRANEKAEAEARARASEQAALEALQAAEQAGYLNASKSGADTGRFRLGDVDSPTGQRVGERGRRGSYERIRRLSLKLTGQALENGGNVGSVAPSADSASKASAVAHKKPPLVLPGTMKFPVKIDPSEAQGSLYGRRRSSTTSIERVAVGLNFGVGGLDQSVANFGAVLVGHSLKLPPGSAGSPTSPSHSLSPTRTPFELISPKPAKVSPPSSSVKRAKAQTLAQQHQLTHRGKVEKTQRASSPVGVAVEGESLAHPTVSLVEVSVDETLQAKSGSDPPASAAVAPASAQPQQDPPSGTDNDGDEDSKQKEYATADVLMDRAEEGSYHSFADSDEDLTIVDDLVESMLQKPENNNQRSEEGAPMSFAEMVAFRRAMKTSAGPKYIMNPSDPEVLLWMQRLKEMEPEPPRIPARPSNRPKSPLKLNVDASQDVYAVTYENSSLVARHTAKLLSRSSMSEPSRLLAHSSTVDRILEVSSIDAVAGDKTISYRPRRDGTTTAKVNVKVNLANLTKDAQRACVNGDSVTDGGPDIFDEQSFYADKGAMFGDDIAVGALMLDDTQSQSKLIDFLISDAGDGGSELDLASVASDGSRSRQSMRARAKNKDPLVRVVTNFEAMKTVKADAVAKGNAKMANSLLLRSNGAGLIGMAVGERAFHDGEDSQEELLEHGKSIIGAIDAEEGSVCTMDASVDSRGLTTAGAITSGIVANMRSPGGIPPPEAGALDDSMVSGFGDFADFPEAKILVENVAGIPGDEGRSTSLFGAGPISTDSIDSAAQRVPIGGDIVIDPFGITTGSPNSEINTSPLFPKAESGTFSLSARIGGDDGDKEAAGPIAATKSSGDVRGESITSQGADDFIQEIGGVGSLPAETSQLALSSVAESLTARAIEQEGSMNLRRSERPSSAKVIDLTPFGTRKKSSPRQVPISRNLDTESSLLSSEAANMRAAVAIGSAAVGTAIGRKGDAGFHPGGSFSSDRLSLNAKLQMIPVERHEPTLLSSSFASTNGTQFNSNRPGRIGAPFPRDAYVEVMHYTLDRRAMAPVMPPFDYSRAVKKSKPGLLRKLVTTEQELRQRHQYLRDDTRLQLSATVIAGPMSTTTSLLSRSAEFNTNTNTAMMDKTDDNQNHSMGQLDINDFSAPSMNPKPPSRGTYRKAVDKAAFASMNLPFLTMTSTATATADAQQASYVTQGTASIIDEENAGKMTDRTTEKVPNDGLNINQVDHGLPPHNYDYQVPLAGSYSLDRAFAGSFATTVISSLMRDNESRKEELLNAAGAEGLAATLQALSQSRSPSRTALLRSERTTLSPPHSAQRSRSSSPLRNKSPGRPKSPLLYAGTPSSPGSSLVHVGEAGFTMGTTSDLPFNRIDAASERPHTQLPQQSMSVPGIVTPVAVPSVSVEIATFPGCNVLVDKPLLISQPQTLHPLVELEVDPQGSLQSSSMELQPRPISASRGKIHSHQRRGSGTALPPAPLSPLNTGSNKVAADISLPFGRSFISNSEKSDGDAGNLGMQQLSTAMTTSTDVNLFSLATSDPTRKSGFLNSARSGGGGGSGGAILGPVRTNKGVLAKGKTLKKGPGSGLQQESSIYSGASTGSEKLGSIASSSLGFFDSVRKETENGIAPLSLYPPSLIQMPGSSGGAATILRAAPAPEDDGFVRVTKPLLVPSAGSRVLNTSTSNILDSIVNLGVPSVTSAPLPPEVLGSTKTAAGIVVSSFARVPHAATASFAANDQQTGIHVPWIPEGGNVTLDHDRSDFVLGWEESKILKERGGPDVSAAMLRLKRQQYVRDSFEEFAKTIPASSRQRSREVRSQAGLRGLYIGGSRNDNHNMISRKHKLY